MLLNACEVTNIIQVTKGYNFLQGLENCRNYKCYKIQPTGSYILYVQLFYSLQNYTQVYVASEVYGFIRLIQFIYLNTRQYSLSEVFFIYNILETQLSSHFPYRIAKIYKIWLCAILIYLPVCGPPLSIWTYELYHVQKTSQLYVYSPYSGCTVLALQHRNTTLSNM